MPHRVALETLPNDAIDRRRKKGVGGKVGVVVTEDFPPKASAASFWVEFIKLGFATSTVPLLHYDKRHDTLISRSVKKGGRNVAEMIIALFPVEGTRHAHHLANWKEKYSPCLN